MKPRVLEMRWQAVPSPVPSQPVSFALVRATLYIPSPVRSHSSRALCVTCGMKDVACADGGMMDVACGVRMGDGKPSLGPGEQT
jgi:hypothetical protein